MKFIIYSVISIFIIILIIVFIINKCKYFMLINSTNIMGIDGKIVMDEKYEPKLNELTTLKNVLNIKKGLYTIYKPSVIQQNFNIGDTVNFGSDLNIIRISDSISFSHNNANNSFNMVNTSDTFKYIKITYVPPVLSGTDVLCRFNIFINNEAINMTSTIYRIGSGIYSISSISTGIYIMKLIPRIENVMDIRITEMLGNINHLGYEGYIIFEEL